MPFSQNMKTSFGSEAEGSWIIRDVLRSVLIKLGNPAASDASGFGDHLQSNVSPGDTAEAINAVPKSDLHWPESKSAAAVQDSSLDHAGALSSSRTP